MMRTISISLPSELRAEVDRLADAEGVSRSKLIRAALREHFFVRRFRTLRQELMPYAAARGIYTDEDVFVDPPTEEVNAPL
ncbi:MAG TPA: ribbon-helix-helix protein, CopG family [Longimicrobium sp.]|jgi:metal-responsive CopG/Arc/MetJ family transcriptional regulator